MGKASRVCSQPSCPTLTRTGGRCDQCKRQADRIRGTAHERGYTGAHLRFRKAVLTRDPRCVLCGRPSTVADHHPLSRRDLVAQGLDPNDPKHGRGLDKGCHDRETARSQPGGWNV